MRSRDKEGNTGECCTGSAGPIRNHVAVQEVWVHDRTDVRNDLRSEVWPPGGVGATQASAVQALRAPFAILLRYRSTDDGSGHPATLPDRDQAGAAVGPPRPGALEGPVINAGAQREGAGRGAAGFGQRLQRLTWRGHTAQLPVERCQAPGSRRRRRLRRPATPPVLTSAEMSPEGIHTSLACVRCACGGSGARGNICTPAPARAHTHTHTNPYLQQRAGAMKSNEDIS
jgi:hypothetical protein